MKLKDPPANRYIPQRYLHKGSPSRFKNFKYRRKLSYSDQTELIIDSTAQKLAWNNMHVNLTENPYNEIGNMTAIASVHSDDTSLYFAAHISKLINWDCLWFRVNENLRFPKGYDKHSFSTVVLWGLTDIPKDLKLKFKNLVLNLRDSHHLILITPSGKSPLEYCRTYLGFPPGVVFLLNKNSYKEIHSL